MRVGKYISEQDTRTMAQELCADDCYYGVRCGPVRDWRSGYETWMVQSLEGA